MTRTFPIPCIDCGTPALATRCPTCATVATRRRRNPLYDTPAWRRLARRTIAAQPWCSYCGSTTDLTADHIVPVVRGGVSDATNVLTACRSCNSAKGAR